MKITTSFAKKFLATLVGFAVGFSASAQTVSYYHNDISGTPIAATDAAGNLLWKENYRPYGEKLNNQTAGSANKIGFHGKPFDNNTGLSYMGARYYDPVAGRFLGIDQVGFTLDNVHSFNRYAYANNNPYKYVDPDGRFSLVSAAVVVVGVLYAGAVIQAQKNSPKPSTQSLAAAYDRAKQAVSNMTEAAARALGMNAEGAPAQEGSETGSKEEGKKIPNEELKAPPDKRGNAPIGSDGKPVELHHNGQEPDSPLDEMTQTEHRGKDNFKKNHENTGKESSKIDRKKFDKERTDYWKKEWDSGRFKGM